MPMEYPNYSLIFNDYKCGKFINDIFRLNVQAECEILKASTNKVISDKN
jgi:hypothetical protein